MMRKKIIKEKIVFILTLIIIVFSDETMMFGTNGNTIFINLKYLVQITLCLVVAFFFIKDNSVRRVQLPGQNCLMLCILIIISMIINRDIRSGYFIMLIVTLMSYLFAYYVDFYSPLAPYLKSRNKIKVAKWSMAFK